MRHEGAGREVICKVLRIIPNTLTNYLRPYRDRGIAGFAEQRYYKPARSLEPFWSCLHCAFTISRPPGAAEAASRIEELAGIRLSDSQTSRSMKQLGMALRKCAPIPGKVDPQLQLDFYKEELQPWLQEASRGERKVFFAGAAHFVLGAFLGMV